jgi:hypothetical protein
MILRIKIIRILSELLKTSERRIPKLCTLSILEDGELIKLLPFKNVIVVKRGNIPEL